MKNISTHQVQTIQDLILSLAEQRERVQVRMLNHEKYAICPIHIAREARLSNEIETIVSLFGAKTEWPGLFPCFELPDGQQFEVTQIRRLVEAAAYEIL